MYQNFGTILKVSSIAGVSATRESNGRFFVSKRLLIFQIFLIVMNFIHFCFSPWYIFSLQKEIDGTNDWQLTNSTSHTGTGTTDVIAKVANIMLLSGATLLSRISNAILLPRYLPLIFRRLAHLQTILSRDLHSGMPADVPGIWIFVVLIGLESFPLQIYTFIIAHSETSGTHWYYKAIIGFGLFGGFASVCVEVQFIYLCCIIRNTFRAVNERIRSGRRDHKSSLLFPNVFQAQDILALRSQCYSLQKVCGDLNHLYNFQLFFLLISSGLLSLIAFYFGIFGGYRYAIPLKNHINTMSYTIRTLAWTGHYNFRFFAICLATNYLTAEASRTKDVLFKLIHKCRDKHMKKEIWILYIFLICNKCHFTACGFFEIGLPLVTSAVAAGTTYIVILVQMHQI